MSQLGKQIDVWGVGGGQGTTTIAAVLASFLGTSLETAQPWIVESMFGVDGLASAGRMRVVDRGVLSDEEPDRSTRLIVVRGPSTVGLAALQRAGVSLTDIVVVVEEPWRVLAATAANEVLDVPKVLVAPFSERVARQSDAGLLGLRLDQMSEFEALRLWAREKARTSGLTTSPSRSVG